MTLLTMIQDAVDIIGLTRPNSIINSTDLAVRQLMSLANVEGQNLARRYDWQRLVQVASFTTLATEIQGQIGTLAPGFKYMITGTMWDNSRTIEIKGPLSPQEYARVKSVPYTGPYPWFRVYQNQLHFFPVPAAGNAIVFEFQSVNWCASSGGTPQSAWAADDDVGILDEYIMMLGLIWRYKQQKGLDYSEDFNNYESSLALEMAQEGPKRPLSLNGITLGQFGEDCTPRIWAPIGSWQV